MHKLSVTKIKSQLYNTLKYKLTNFSEKIILSNIFTIHKMYTVMFHSYMKKLNINQARIITVFQLVILRKPNKIISYLGCYTLLVESSRI